MKIKYKLLLLPLIALYSLTSESAFAKSGKCSVGEFLFSTKCRDCKPGCYCTGGGTQTMSLDPSNKISAGVLEAYCRHERNDCPKGNANGGEEYGACGRHNNAKLYRCPNDFPNSDAKSTSAEQCYTTAGSKRLYYKKIKCDAGQYLPINADKCTDCKSGRYYCPGTASFYPSVTKDQGIKECPSGQQPNSRQTSCEGSTVKCDAGYYLPSGWSSCSKCKSGRYYVCFGGTFTKGSTGNLGLDKCTGGMIADDEHKRCISDNSSKQTDSEQTDSEIHVEPGKYLPATKTEPKDCVGAKKYCPGGDFKKKSIDQGIFDCPLNARANDAKSACRITLTQEQLRSGAGIGKFDCWALTIPEDYRTCVYGTYFKDDRYYK